MTLKGSRTVATGGVEKRAVRYRAPRRPTLIAPAIRTIVASIQEDNSNIPQQKSD
jgi:hypothetical protein